MRKLQKQNNVEKIVHFILFFELILGAVAFLSCLWFSTSEAIQVKTIVSCFIVIGVTISGGHVYRKTLEDDEDDDN